MKLKYVVSLISLALIGCASKQEIPSATADRCNTSIISADYNGQNNENPVLLNKLGFMYAQGDKVPQDYKKAVQCYQEAIDKGNISALNNLGYLYQKGLGVPKNQEKAIEYYQKAANLGSSTAVTNLHIISNTH